MHPRQFLDNFWSNTLKYQVFVAMPFGGKFDTRFADIYKPALERINVALDPLVNPIEMTKLSAYRVDNNRTGESILTEIMDGIVHSYFILADISEFGRWIDENKEVYTTPNGNVMYEVGLALACRQQSEVLLVRDKNDKGKLLFDVSTIPHISVDFGNLEKTKNEITSNILDRIKERNWSKSKIITSTISSLSHGEIRMIRENKDNPLPLLGWKQNSVNFTVDSALSRLIDKGILQYYTIHQDEQIPLYKWTPFGNVVKNMLPNVESTESA